MNMTNTQQVTIRPEVDSKYAGQSLDVHRWTSMGTVHVWINEDETLSFDAKEVE